MRTARASSPQLKTTLARQNTDTAALHEEPDYRKYSLDELRDASRHIDANAFPARAARLAQELASRQDELSEEKRRLACSERSTLLPRRTAGYCLVVSGVISLAGTADAVQSTQSRALILAIAGTIYGSMILAGVLLILRRRIGLWIGVIVTLAQLPLLRVWRVYYAITFFPATELRLWPPIEITFTMGHKLQLHWLSEVQPLYVGVNITAAFVLAILCGHISHMRQARERLRAMRDAG